MLMPGVVLAHSAISLRLYSRTSGFVMHRTSQRKVYFLFVRRAGPSLEIDINSGRFAASVLSPKHAMLVYILGFGFPTVPDSGLMR